MAAGFSPACRDPSQVSARRRSGIGTSPARPSACVVGYAAAHTRDPDPRRRRRRHMSETQPGRSSYQAVARLPSVDAARRAVEELRQAGFDDERISVSDESTAEMSEPERRQRDQAIGRRTRGATWGWAAGGALAGAAIGCVGTIVFSDAGITAIATAGVAAAILVGIVAGLVGGYGSLR